MKHLINIDNYEQYALDYIEGNLDGDLKTAFEQFLIRNPDIEEELELMADAVLEPMDEETVFDSSRLKINVSSTDNINEANYEDYLVAELEGDLNAEESMELEAFMAKNSFLQRDRELFQKTRLESDTSVRYTKNDLKKPIPLWEYTQTAAFRVAAGIALLFGIAGILNQLDDQVYQQRQRDLDFANIEVATPVSSENTENPVRTGSNEMLAVVDESESQNRPVVKNEKAPIQPMKARDIEPLRHSIDEQLIALRETEPIEPKLKAWVESNQPSRQQALTLGQYLGKEILGKDPNENTKEFVVKEVTRVANQSGVVKADKKDDKRTIQLLAGAFEFKRVDYKN